MADEEKRYVYKGPRTPLPEVKWRPPAPYDGDLPPLTDRLPHFVPPADPEAKIYGLKLADLTADELRQLVCHLAKKLYGNLMAELDTRLTDEDRELLKGRE